MSLLCPHLIHLWRPWQGIGKSPRRQVALKRHSTHGTEISLDDIDAEFARDNHCLTLCMYILCIYNVARASGNAQCACSCIYYACTCTYVHVHIPNVLVILYGRSAAIFPTDTQISRFPHYDSRIQSSRFRRAAFYNGLKSKVGLAAAKTAAMRINLNIDGCGVVAPPVHSSLRAPHLLANLLAHLPLPRAAH